MILALVHGWTAGTDTSAEAVRWLYVVTLAVLVGALTSRAGLALAASRHRGSSSGHNDG